MSTTKETEELIDSLSAIAVRTISSLADDGKFSTFEVALFAKDFSVIKAGIVGVSDIPRELTDLTSDEMFILRAKIITELKKLGVKGPIQEVTDIILELLYRTAVSVSRIKILLKQP